MTVSKAFDFKELHASLVKAIGENDETQGVRHWLSTGYLPLDQAVSGLREGGGMPCGRIIEIAGPPSAGKTALATQVMIAAQKAGGIAAFHDHERSFDVTLAKRLGLRTDTGQWLFKTPRTFEDSITVFMNAARLIRASKFPKDAPLVWVFDSLASMIPQSQLEKEISKQGMADQTALARATSLHFRVLALLAEELNVCLLFLNQIRTKPGICLRGDVMIPFTDGTSMPIRDVVEKKIAKDVWSWNEIERRFEAKQIIQWHDNGPVASPDEWVRVRTTGRDTRNGVKAVTVTRGHEILERARGWVAAESLTVGDQLLTRTVNTINGTYAEFLRGAMLGDCSLVNMKPGRLTAQLRFQDNVDPEYVAWKISKLAPMLDFKQIPIKWPTGPGIRYDSVFSHELADHLPLIHNPVKLLAGGISPMMLALWIMDDGHLSEDRRYYLSLKRIKNIDILNMIADSLFEYGLRSHVGARESSLTFGADSTRLLSKMIAPFVPACMERKLLPEHRGLYQEFNLVNSQIGVEAWETVTQVRGAGKTFDSINKRNRYDIGVGSNHNYLAGSVDGGFLVHNSYGDPTTTPGGDAPKFYSSVRIMLGAGRIMEGTGDTKEQVGSEVTARMIKNKVNRPFLKTKWQFMFRADGSGYFDTVGSLLEVLIARGVLACTKSRVDWVDGTKPYKKELIEKLSASPAGVRVLEQMMIRAGLDVEHDGEAAKLAAGAGMEEVAAAE